MCRLEPGNHSWVSGNAMAHHGFVRDVAVLLKAGLALLLLRGHVVRDVGVVALLCTRDTLQPL